MKSNQKLGFGWKKVDSTVQKSKPKLTFVSCLDDLDLDSNHLKWWFLEQLESMVTLDWLKLKIVQQVDLEL